MKQSFRKIIGFHACRQALKVRPQSITLAYISHHWQKSKTLRDFHNLLTDCKIPIEYKGQNFLKGWQGLALDCNSRPLWDWNVIKSSKKMILVAIDCLEDPQNLGNIIRSSWLFGVYGILLSKHHCVHLTPSVHKIASGGAEYVCIEIASDLSGHLKKLKDLGFWVYGLESYKEKNVKLLWQEDFPEKVVLVVGAEDKGLHAAIKKSCDQILTIPQIDKAHSLNAATSLAVALYEVRRNFAT